MTQRIKVTGIINLEDEDFDSGPLGPLTERADMEYRNQLSAWIDDIEFELVGE